MTRERLARIRALSRELAELTDAELRELDAPPEHDARRRPRITDLDVERAQRALRRKGRLPG